MNVSAFSFVIEKLQKGDREMKLLRKRNIVILSVVIGLVIASVALSSGKKEQGIKVKTTAVKQDNLVAAVFATGNIKAAEQTDIYCEVNSSSIDTVLLESGMDVFQGQGILKLNDTDIKLEIEQAKATLATEENSLRAIQVHQTSLEAEMKSASTNLERMKVLFKEGAVTKQDLENAELNYTLAQAKLAGNDIEGTKSRVAKALLNIDVLEKQLNDTEIKSPIDGHVLKLDVKSGEPVGKGKLLAVVGKLDQLEAEIGINEIDASRVTLGDKAEIHGSGLSSEKYKGEIIYIAPIAELVRTASGDQNLVKVKVALDQREYELKPGFSVNAKIILEEKPQALVVPFEAVVERSEKTVVFVVDEENIATQKEVEVGISTELYKEIISGVEVGEKVIVEPPQELKDKAKVIINDKSN